MRRFFSLLLVVASATALLGCGGGKVQRPASVPQPGMDARLTHEVFFGSQSSAPATIEVSVTNRAAVPIQLRRVELDSPGMGQWGILRRTEYFNDTIGPGETRTRAIVVTAVTTTRRPSEPLQIRAIFELESGGVYWREMLFARQ